MSGCVGECRVTLQQHQQHGDQASSLEMRSAAMAGSWLAAASQRRDGGAPADYYWLRQRLDHQQQQQQQNIELSPRVAPINNCYFNRHHGKSLLYHPASNELINI